MESADSFHLEIVLRLYIDFTLTQNNATILHCSINEAMIQTWLQKLDAALQKA